MSLIKRLSKSVREFKKTAILTPITVTFEVIMEVVIPMLMASLIDSGIDTVSYTHLRAHET